MIAARASSTVPRGATETTDPSCGSRLSNVSPVRGELGAADDVRQRGDGGGIKRGHKRDRTPAREPLRRCPAEPNRRSRRRGVRRPCAASCRCCSLPPSMNPLRSSRSVRPSTARAWPSPASSADVSPDVMAQAGALARERILPLVVVLLVDEAAPTDLRAPRRGAVPRRRRRHRRAARAACRTRAWCSSSCRRTRSCTCWPVRDGRTPPPPSTARSTVAACPQN